MADTPPLAAASVETALLLAWPQAASPRTAKAMISARMNSLPGALGHWRACP
jgi:hypothetical protein